MSGIGSFNIITYFGKAALSYDDYYEDNGGPMIELSKKFNLIDNILGTSMTIKHVENLIYSVPSNITIEDLQLLTTSESSSTLRNYSSISDEKFLYERFTTLKEHNGTRLSAISLFYILLKIIFDIFPKDSSIYNKAGIVLILPVDTIQNSNNIKIVELLDEYTTNMADFLDEVIALGFTNDEQNMKLESFKNGIQTHIMKHFNVRATRESSKWYFLMTGLYSGNLKNAVIGAMGIFAERDRMYKYYFLMALTISVKDETLPLIYYLLNQAKNAYDLENDYEHDISKFIALVEIVFYAPKTNKLISVLSNEADKFYSFMNEEMGKGDYYDYNEQNDPLSEQIKALYENITDNLLFFPKTLIDIFVKNQYPTSFPKTLQAIFLDQATPVEYSTKFVNFLKLNVPEQFRDFFVNNVQTESSKQRYYTHSLCLFVLCTEMLCNGKVTPAGLEASSNTERIEEKINERAEFIINDPGRHEFMSSVMGFSQNRRNDFIVIQNDEFYRLYLYNIGNANNIYSFTYNTLLPRSVSQNTFLMDPENFSIMIKNILRS